MAWKTESTPHVPERKEEKNGNKQGYRQAAWGHEGVEQDDVGGDRCQDNQRERYEAVHKQKQAAECL